MNRILKQSKEISNIIEISVRIKSRPVLDDFWVELYYEPMISS